MSLWLCPEFSTFPINGQNLFPLPLDLLGHVTWQYNGIENGVPVVGFKGP